MLAADPLFVRMVAGKLAGRAQRLEGCLGASQPAVRVLAARPPVLHLNLADLGNADRLFCSRQHRVCRPQDGGDESSSPGTRVRRGRPVPGCMTEAR